MPARSEEMAAVEECKVAVHEEMPAVEECKVAVHEEMPVVYEERMTCEGMTYEAVMREATVPKSGVHTHTMAHAHTVASTERHSVGCYGCRANR